MFSLRALVLRTPPFPCRTLANSTGWMAAKKSGEYVAPVAGDSKFVERAEKRLAFPTHHLTLRLERTAEMKRENKFVFIIPPRMGKWELKEMLQKVYDVDVVKVNVANYDGKMKRWQVSLSDL